MRKCCMLMMMMAATGCWAQTDSSSVSGCGQSRQEVNSLNFGLNFVTHGEMCGGGLPRQADGSFSTEDHSSFLFGRTRLIVDYTRAQAGNSTSVMNPALQVHAVIQNKAVWGMKGNQSLNLYEGWVKMTARNGLFAQVGRVALSYDDERIIGTNDFATAALSHDVVRVGYEGHGHKAHAILAYNQNGENVYNGTYYDNGAQYYKTLQTVWYHYDVPKFPLGASLLFMNIGVQAGLLDDEYNQPSNQYQQMYGGYFNFHPRHLTLEGSYYQQTGKIVNKIKLYKPVEAWMASVKATVMPTDRYGIELGFDYLSGDDYVPVIYNGSVGMVFHEKEKGFSPMYGSRSKFYGIMDYFYESAYSNGFTPGLQNAFVGLIGNFTDKLKCKAAYHYLAVATNLDNLDRTLGHSIDLQASYRFSKDISLIAGYTQMMGTETMDRLKQGNSSKRARWGWFSLVISPSLFTTKW